MLLTKGYDEFLHYVKYYTHICIVVGIGSVDTGCIYFPEMFRLWYENAHFSKKVNNHTTFFEKTSFNSFRESGKLTTRNAFFLTGE